jgi:hypothetical protein
VSTAMCRLRSSIFLPLCRCRHNYQRVPGRKRGLAVDVLGVIIAVVVGATFWLL